jgi:hypothetical protein
VAFGGGLAGAPTFTVRGCGVSQLTRQFAFASQH